VSNFVKPTTEETHVSKPQINVTPLIDVLLVLLIIFMVITPVKPSAFKARIPAEQHQDLIVEPNPCTLLVTVGSDGSLRLNTEAAAATVDDTANLTDRLRDVFEARERNVACVDGAGSENETPFHRTVFIKAPRSLPYGSVAKVVDAVKMGGARPISLQIDDLE
jgi:biopolymer transport protein ExbD